MEMTNQEAIETINANYPDERYTMLREADSKAYKTANGCWKSLDGEMSELLPDSYPRRSFGVLRDVRTEGEVGMKTEYVCADCLCRVCARNECTDNYSPGITKE